MISKAGFKVALCLAIAVLLGFPAAARAQSIIKQPGNHPDYSFEIEPHMDFQWSNRFAGDGFGPGVRANIPILRNGFIPKLNNNVAISFGFDITFGGGGYNCYRYYRDVPGYDCSVTEFWFPVALQWNFWLTKVVSVFGEPGFAIAHRRWSYPWYCDPRDPRRLCEDWHDSRTDFEPVFWAGGRFQFSDTIGATVRIGFPMISAGLNILL